MGIQVTMLYIYDIHDGIHLAMVKKNCANIIGWLKNRPTVMRCRSGTKMPLVMLGTLVLYFYRGYFFILSCKDKYWEYLIRKQIELGIKHLFICLIWFIIPRLEDERWDIIY